LSAETQPEKDSASQILAAKNVSAGVQP